MKKNEKGFTLIELLAVVVILGLLLAIAIPGITKYITEARRKTLMTTINRYIEASSASVNNGDFIFSENNVIYAIPIECIPMERGGDNPFGEWLQVNDEYWAYVLVQYDYDNFNYIYGFTFKDSAGYGMHPIKQEFMSIKGQEIETGFELGRPRTGLYGYFSNEEYWESSGFNVNENTRVKVLLSKSEGIHGDGEDTCTLQTKGTNYTELEEIKKRPGTLINSGRNENLVFGKEISKETIESITTKNYVDVPSNAIDSWDASIQKNESIKAWITDSDNDNLYELYLGQEGGVAAPSNSNYLFSDYTNVTNIDIKNMDTSNVVWMENMFVGCKKLKTLDLSNFNTSNVTTMSNMFLGCNNLKKINLNSFNTSKVTTMSGMFEGCNKLENLDISNFDTSNVTSFTYMFYGCNELKSLNVSNFNTIKATNMGYMFANCKALTSLNLNNFNTSNVTDMGRMFMHTSSLTNLNIDNFNTTNVTSMWQMFYNSSALTNLNLNSFNTSNVTSMNGMFQNCYSITTLDLSNFDTSKVKDMGGMFWGMSSLTSLNVNGFDTKNVTSMRLMFANCSKLNTVNLSSFDTSNVTDMWRMFINMSSLSTIDLSNFNTDNVTSVDTMFHGCSNLNYLDIRSFNPTNITDYYNMLGYVPNTSKIIVKDDATRDWIHTNINSNLTNIITVNEL